MAGSPKRIYWDACTWIALIQREKIRNGKGVVTEDRDTMCRTVWTAAHKDKTVELVTSALSLVEVSKVQRAVPQDAAKMADFFEHPHIEVVNVDRFVGERARELMQAGYAKLYPPDAIHIATAALGNVSEMHTFDDRILDLDGLIVKADGSKLKICKPDAGPSIPLFNPPLLKEAEAETEEAPEENLNPDLGQRPEPSRPQVETAPAVAAEMEPAIETDKA